MEILIRSAAISWRASEPAAMHPEILFGVSTDHDFESGYDLLGEILQILFSVSAALKSDTLESNFYVFAFVRAAEKKYRAFVHKMKGSSTSVG